MSSSNHALIFGASGVSGWGTMIQALSYPTPTTFGSVTGITNRPLKKDDALLPDDERIMLVSGVNLSLTSEAVINALKANVPHINNITHVFFCAYIHSPDRETLSVANTPIIENALAALKHLCPNLKHFVLQTGGSVRHLIIRLAQKKNKVKNTLADLRNTLRRSISTTTIQRV